MEKLLLPSVLVIMCSTMGSGCGSPESSDASHWRPDAVLDVDARQYQVGGRVVYSLTNREGDGINHNSCFTEAEILSGETWQSPSVQFWSSIDDAGIRTPCTDSWYYLAPASTNASSWLISMDVVPGTYRLKTEVATVRLSEDDIEFREWIASESFEVR